MSQLSEDRIRALVDCFPDREPGSAEAAFRSVLSASLRPTEGHPAEPTLVEAAIVHATSGGKVIDPEFEPQADLTRLAQWCHEADERVAAYIVPDLPAGRPPDDDAYGQDEARTEAAGAKALRHRFL